MVNTPDLLKPQPVSARLADFLAHGWPVDYRAYLSNMGLELLNLELKEPGERLVVEDQDGIAAVARLALLPWDTDFFNVRSGRIEGLWFRRETESARSDRKRLFSLVSKAAERAGIKFLMCRVIDTDVVLMEALADIGFVEVDRMVIFAGSLEHKITARASATSIPPSDLERCIAGMKLGRLHADTHIRREIADEFYVQTARSLISNGAHVSTASVGERIVGVAIGREEPQISEWIDKRFGLLWLMGVDPEYRGQGIGRQLFGRFCAEFSDRCNYLEIGTQLDNLGAQKIYRERGFKEKSGVVTFHKWTDAGNA